MQSSVCKIINPYRNSIGIRYGLAGDLAQKNIIYL